MTEKMRYPVTLPAWAISLICAVFMSIIGFSFANGKTNQKVENLQSDVDRIYIVLDRIDIKLDRLMQNKSD